MNFSQLKKTNIKISEIGFGTNAVGGHNLYANTDEELGRKVIEEAVSGGVTFFDTSDSYGFGRSEEILGETIKNKRSELVIATKGGIERLDNGSVRINNSPEYMRRAVENSLQRLKTDYIDLYYIHFVDPTIPLSESIGELSLLKKEGKIRSIGISNADLEQLKAANSTNEISAVSSPYNMLERDVEETVLPYCVQNEISYIPYGPLAFGILGGKYTNEFVLEKADWRNDLELFKQEVYQENLGKVEKLKKIALEKEMSLPNLALSWLLVQKGVDAVIPGGKRPEQVRQNIQASSTHLNTDDIKKIENILEIIKM
ncbi:protein IolS [Bacillus cereus ATCC 4342]|uniref:aldo/keto reductase n=1 Tax=Bacillus tropicus TaxID=2026188 RepID=UPI0001A0173C|nr:aldo/keto reductase [Bacillus tropicus]AJH72091.1 aldo/keto reductase family protein [Bacillus cereus ATCC 4342]EEK85610.1 Oxidoreductase, aldo/keto reductase [Bacillus cereus ATCC 4342]KFM87970.1 protein IolS [Bacillus cereus ATCC 4342]MDR4453920.1 aldo/keto reductase [Bacillus tropicus]QKH54201.1 aldo/keto reductase [Bacillus tropicus]